MAALVLGFFVLSKAFPSGSETPVEATPGDGGVVQTSPPPVVSPSPQKSMRQPAEPKEPSELDVQVLNGTDVAGLAGDTAEILEAEGYNIATVEDAEGSYDVTTIFYTPKRKIEAQVLRDAFFPTATLEVADPDVKVDLTVTLGADYAASVGAADEGGAAPEESPT